MEVINDISETIGILPLGFALLLFILIILLLKKLYQLTRYRYILMIHSINEKYEQSLTTPVTVISDQTRDVSLQSYLLDRQTAIYQGNSEEDQFFIDKQANQYSIPKPVLEQFFYTLSHIKLMIQSRNHGRKPLLMFELQDPLLLVSLLDKHQWDEFERLFTKRQLAPVVYLAVRQASMSWDQLSVSDQIYVRGVFKDYGRRGIEKLAVYLTRRERRLLVAFGKKLKAN